MTNKPIIPKAEQNLKPAIRAYLGGSFDPVHNGHMHMAMTVYNTLTPIATEHNRELQVSLLPNARSPFKTQSTDPNDRLAMLKLAEQQTPLLINELELWQTPPVYTIDSVRALRNQYPRDSLIFIMGMDSARSLAQWKEGLQVTDYVNLWIFNRNEHLMQHSPNNAVLANELPVELQAQITASYSELLSLPITQDYNSLADKPLKAKHQGRIYLDTRAVISVSSTEIRKQLSEHDYKQDRHLSTSAGQTITMPNKLDKWLNPKVYHYIIDHQLYSAD